METVSREERDAREAEEERQREARAAAYDQDRAVARLAILRAQADAGFMRHILANPGSEARRETAREFLARAQKEITSLESRAGDLETVSDPYGILPATRREWNRDSYLNLFRDELLRAWAQEEPDRFGPLLALPVPETADMCSECQAPADWHTYAISLRLQDAQRCPVSATTGLPEFDDEQWQAMLPPPLKALFAPEKPWGSPVDGPSLRL